MTRKYRTSLIETMKPFDSSEQERLQNWRALQIELGLISDEAVVHVPASEPTSDVSSAEHDETPSSNPVSVDSSSASDQETGDLVTTDYTVAESTEQEVEVGEAPEEVPDEPGEELGTTEKKRRRRRRRRRRNDAAETTSSDGEDPDSHANGALTEGESPAEDDSSSEETDDTDDGADDDDEEVIEPIVLPDWNVPTWQELIDSLYRPER
jgi:hypothetical protein